MHALGDGDVESEVHMRDTGDVHSSVCSLEEILGYRFESNQCKRWSNIWESLNLPRENYTSEKDAEMQPLEKFSD